MALACAIAQQVRINTTNASGHCFPWHYLLFYLASPIVARAFTRRAGLVVGSGHFIFHVLALHSFTTATCTPFLTLILKLSPCSSPVLYMHPFASSHLPS